MALYTSGMDLGLAMPTPAHTLTPGAIEAVNMMRSLGYRQRVDREVSSLVTEHGHRRLIEHKGAPPAPYVRLKLLAEAHGWTVTEYRSPTGHALQGRRDDLAFRASWQWGKTRGASWHEREERWALVPDARPIRMDATAKVALKGARSRGMGTARLTLIATPFGLPLKLGALEEKINTKSLTWDTRKREWS